MKLIDNSNPASHYEGWPIDINKIMNNLYIHFIEEKKLAF